eukprot:TRINITY_DN8630_c0_g1_i1.p1 TRINITY_DN8630_c0_g1~~TRINITY_DN8630_c0_g1_i1.p1  ORF type:complete len:295 (-),score=34.36 TRINITY_DN8630_c0_g1_i1:58-942(-)
MMYKVATVIVFLAIVAVYYFYYILYEPIDVIASCSESNSTDPYFVPSFPSSQPHVCFVVRTYYKHEISILALVASVLGSGVQNASFHFLDTQINPTFDVLPDIVELINELYGRDVAQASPFTYEAATIRFPTIKNFTDYGYIQTDLYIHENILRNTSTKCDYIVVTNGDNLYSTQLLNILRPVMMNKIQLIGFEFISHYGWSYVDPNIDYYWVPREGLDVHILTEFQANKVDLGAVAFQVERWREKNATFLLDKFLKNITAASIDAHNSDAFFIPMFAEGSTTETIKSVLFVHQ